MPAKGAKRKKGRVKTGQTAPPKILERQTVDFSQGPLNAPFFNGLFSSGFSSHKQHRVQSVKWFSARHLVLAAKAERKKTRTKCIWLPSQHHGT